MRVGQYSDKERKENKEIHKKGGTAQGRPGGKHGEKRTVHKKKKKTGKSLQRVQKK